VGAATQENGERIDTTRLGCELSGGGQAVGRVIELDSLRGLAAIAVIVFHSKEAWLPCGWAGVDLFFVLSGYLITSIVLRDGATNAFLREFYVRRGLRTWPIYYLLIALVIIVSPVVARRPHWSALPYALTYAQGLPRVWGGTVDAFSPYLTHTWSLAIEEQFYLIWPALVLIAGTRRLPVLALTFVAVAVAARSQGVWWDILTRSDGLALGGLLAAYRLGRQQSANPNSGFYRLGTGIIGFSTLSALVMLIALGFTTGLRPRDSVTAYPAVTILAFNLLWLGVIDSVLTNAGGRAIGILRIRLLAQLGRISYGLYLYHLPILMLMNDFARAVGLKGSLDGIGFLSVLIAVPIASLSWRFVERPLLECNRRCRIRRAAKNAERIRVDRPEVEHAAGLRVHDSAFWLEPVRLERSRGFARKEINQIQAIIEENRQLLPDRWHEYFNNG
jgi:peptidoglycan/LPS O-acetylase OafA/YrhL